MTQPIDPGTRRAIEHLLAEHAWLIGHGQAGGVAGLHAEDARVLGIGPDKVGQAAIRAWAAEREATAERRSRHVHGNPRLAAVSPGECRGTVVLTLCRHGGPGRADPAPFMAAEHDDTCRKGPGNVWRFAERRLPVLFGG